MKRYYLLAAAAIVFAGCSNNEFVGEDSGRTQESDKGQIAFSSTLPAATRAWYGADAAKMLNNKFIVSGFYGDKSTNAVANTTTAFDNYQVQWKVNTAGTTASNTADWEYVGIDAAAPSTITGKQTIKYWNYSAGQYDFIAYSTGDNKVVTEGDPAAGSVKVSAIAAPTKDKPAAYTIQGATADLAKCYIADMCTAYNPEQTGKPKFGDIVKFNFRNLATKVRVALYETVPGYSVKDVHFYADDNTNTADDKIIKETKATLYTAGTSKFPIAGTFTVSFPKVGTSNLNDPMYNKAVIAFAATTSDKDETTRTFGNLNYVNSDDPRLVKTGEGVKNDFYLGTSLPKASYAGTTDDHYQTMLPNEAGTTLTLRVNYTLVSNDGSGEEIHVYGAKAIVPAVYAQWKSNYAYTYVFKISDKTNGKTGLGTNDPEGLFPITFDAMITDVQNGNQATVTTVATPSITTYQKGHDPKATDEYSAKVGDIYVMVDGKSDLGTNGQLYTVSAKEGVAISEATVHDALTIGPSRNGITLTKAESDATITAIPGVDGNDITVTAGTAAKFTPAAGTYAYAYKESDGTASELHTAVTLNDESAPKDFGTSYYTDQECKIPATDYKKGTTYYQKVTNTGATYAIKVIKVVE